MNFLCVWESPFLLDCGTIPYSLGPTSSADFLSLYVGYHISEVDATTQFCVHEITHLTQF